MLYSDRPHKWQSLPKRNGFPCSRDGNTFSLYGIMDSILEEPRYVEAD